MYVFNSIQKEKILETFKLILASQTENLIGQRMSDFQ